MITFIRVGEHDLPLPAKQSNSAAGHDLCANESTVVYPGGQSVIGTGWRWDASQYPEIYGRVAPRSGLALKGIDVLAGVVDTDYQGEIRVILINHGERPLDISRGDRIAQLVFERHEDIAVGEGLGFVNDTERGDGGFGSTGEC